MQGTWVWSLGWKDPLEKEMATHSNILAWEIPWTEEPGGLQIMGSQKVGHDLTIKQLNNENNNSILVNRHTIVCLAIHLFKVICLFLVVGYYK